MARADFRQALADHPVGQLGAVAIPAQVSQVKMAQIRRDDFLGHTCGGVVAKMAVAAQDSLFDAPGPFQVILQHFEIVIGFEHQDIGFSNPLDDQLGGMAQIRKKPDVDLRSPKEKADRIISVMRHGKRVDAHVTDIK